MVIALIVKLQKEIYLFLFQIYLWERMNQRITVAYLVLGTKLGNSGLKL